MSERECVCVFKIVNNDDDVVTFFSESLRWCCYVALIVVVVAIVHRTDIKTTTMMNIAMTHAEGMWI